MWTRLPVMLVLTLAVTTAAEAQKVAAQKLGDDSATAFSVDGIDSIGLFNGSLTVKLDLGGAYPTGPGFSYRFTLVLNSRVWDFDPCPTGPFLVSVVEKRFNAGPAWQLSFGRLENKISHWTFISPSGSQHGLYNKLHPGFPATPQNGVFYSTSGSYLRLRHFPDGSALCQDSGECALLQYPDGREQEYLSKTVKGETVWLPTRMEDAHGNWMAIDYRVDGSWRITDTHGRQHDVLFAGPAGDYERITEVRLAKFGGGQATYTFGYESRSLERQQFVPATCPEVAPTVTVDMLSDVTFPDGSWFGMDYYTDDDLNGGVLSGGLSSLRLRSGGEYRYQYTGLVISSQPAGEDENDPPNLSPPEVSHTQGVARKEVALSVGAAAEGVWTYEYNADFGINAPGESGVPCHRETIVTTPEGDQSRHYFSTSNRHRWSFALPFSRCASGTYVNTPPFLSVELYQGTIETGTKVRSVFVEYGSDSLMTGRFDGQDHNARLSFRRTVYHDDDDAIRETAWSDFDGYGSYRTRAETSYSTETRTFFTNHNPFSGTLVVDPDTGDTSGSTFTLLGVNDPWILNTFDERSVTGSGATTTEEFCFDPDTGFLERIRVLAGDTRVGGDVLKVFTPTSSGGFTASEKLYGGDDTPLSDHIYTSLCEMTLPSQPAFQTDHTYASGVLESSTAIDPCDNSAIVSLTDRTIDPDTGMVSASRDSAGVQTDVSYDDEGRLEHTMPADSSSTVYKYQLPTAAQPGLVPQVTVLGCGVGETTCTDAAALTWTRFVSDGLGRRVEDVVRYPGTSGLHEESRTRTYNGMGWLTFETAWGVSAGTSYSDFDRFGRAETIIPPGQPTVRVVHAGDRVRSRMTRVRLETGVVDNWRTEVYDVWNRLLRVCEGDSAEWDENCDGTGVETTYAYDVGNRLTRVCSDWEDGVCGQIRRFVYDNRGFRTQERHPEIGTAAARAPEEPIIDPDGLVELTADPGNDWTFYTHNAQGNPLTVDVQGSTEYDQSLEYDAAGRLIKIFETGDNNPRLLAEFFYARDNDGMNFQAGKLAIQKRHNWIRKSPPLGVSPAGISPDKDADAIVTDVFRYEGRDGRQSQRQTRISFEGSTYAFNTSISYHQLGDPDAVSYPLCLTGCTGLAPDRTVTTSFEKGFVSAIPGYATDIDYQRGGMLHQVTTQNGVVTTIATEASTGLRRPLRISTTAGFDTGDYVYDGSSNVIVVGALQFRYDRFNRMISGQVSAGGVARTQTATYDVFGNLVNLVSGGTTTALTVDPATNRLSGPLAEYDGGGSQIAADYGAERFEYVYDSASMLKSEQSTTGVGRVHLYDAADQRVATWDCGDADCNLLESEQTWTIRGLDGEVLRVFRRGPNKAWSWEADYVHRDTRPLATVTPAGTFYLHQDHLGSTRQVTNAAGAQVSRHDFYPFGGEVTSLTQDEIPFKFTGHERREDGLGTLDYMVARYCSPVLGRFLTIDPGNKRQATNDPQRWNRYAYALNNPMGFVDPDGRESSAAVMLDMDIRALLKGELTREEFRERVRARGVGAIAAAPAAFGIMQLSAGAATAAGVRGAQALKGQFFHLGPAPRGVAAEAKLAELFPGQLPKTFPTIDRFTDAIATSVKSIDLTLKSGRGAQLVSKLNKFVDKLARFKKGKRKGVRVQSEMIEQRVLEIVVNKVGLNAENVAILNQFIERAKLIGIVVRIFVAK